MDIELPVRIKWTVRDSPTILKGDAVELITEYMLVCAEAGESPEYERFLDWMEGRLIDTAWEKIDGDDFWLDPEIADITTVRHEPNLNRFAFYGEVENIAARWALPVQIKGQLDIFGNEVT